MATKTYAGKYQPVIVPNVAQEGRPSFVVVESKFAAPVKIAERFDTGLMSIDIHEALKQRQHG